MVTKKDIVVAILATFCLTSTLFMVIPIKSQVGTTSANEYDPWIDTNDDGIINIIDIVKLALAFGAEGTPINKTAMLLELQARVAALEKMVPQKGRISISPSAFTPSLQLAWWAHNTFEKIGDILRGEGWFYAPIQLPHGARITNMTVMLNDNTDAGYLILTLDAYNYTLGHYLTMASVETTELGKFYRQTLYDDTIPDNTVDNNNCEYYLACYLSAYTSDLEIYMIALDYEYLP